MITFFKYVEPGIFVLQDGTPYSGMINVVGNNVYSGRILNSQSKILSATSTFLADAYKNKIDIGPYYEKPIPLQKVNIVQRDILTSNTISDLFTTLDLNNLKLFASQVTYNPNILNKLTKTQNQLTYTACMTSVGDTFNGKLLPLNRISAKDTSYYNVRTTSDSFNSLFLATSANTFYYFNNSNQMSGKINSLSEVNFASGLTSPTFDKLFFKYNEYNNTIFHTTLNSCYVYNVSYGENGSSLSLNDAFDITATKQLRSRYNSSYGANYRSAIVEDQGIFVLELSYVTNSNSIVSYTPDDLGFDLILKVVQRFEDDILAVIGSINDRIYIKTYDISELITDVKSKSVFELKGSDVDDIYEFANFDSNILIGKNYNNGLLSTIEFRSLISSEYPVIRINADSLLGFLQINDIINQLDDVNINQSSVVLTNSSNPSNSNLIYDIQFAVNDNLNVIVLYNDSFDIINNSFFMSSLPMLLHKEPLSLSLSDNSVGANINSMSKSVLRDVLTLYVNSTKKFKYSAGAIVDIQPNLIPDIDSDNIYMYENEYINVGVLNRIINEMFNVQQKLSMNTYVQE